MRVLVTGASGFVGRWAVQALSVRGHQVWGTGRNALERTPPDLAGYHCGNLANDPELETFVQTAMPEAVLHLAGQASVAVSWKDPSDTLESSVVATVNLFLALRRTSAPLRVFVDVGSAEEYAQGDEILNEDSPIGPSNPYGMGKVAQAHVLALLARDASVPFVHFRAFNHVGPGQHVGFAISDWASQIARAARSAEGITLRVGNLDAVRDFADVRDIVQAYVLALEGGVPQGTYNLSSGVGRTLHSVLQDLIRIAGVDVRVEVDPERMRPLDTPVRVGDNQKIRTMTGWGPAIAWDETLLDTLDSFM